MKGLRIIEDYYCELGSVIADYSYLECMGEDNPAFAKKAMRKARRLLNRVNHDVDLFGRDRTHIENEAIRTHELCRRYVPHVTRALRPGLGFDRQNMVCYYKGDDVRDSYFWLEEDFQLWLHLGTENVEEAELLMRQAEQVLEDAETERNLTTLERRWIKRGTYMIGALLRCANAANLQTELVKVENS